MAPSGTESTLLEIERALIGGCLTDTRGSRVWPANLMPGHFFGDRHSQIWQVMRDLTEHSDHPTIVDLTLELEARGVLQDCGGPGYLAQCLEEGFHAVDLTRYGHLVMTGAQQRYRRALIAQLQNDPDNEEILEHLMHPKDDGFALTLAQAHAERPGVPILTGLGPLDDLTRGIRPGTLTVVGGRTSHGKSSLLAYIAWKMARRGVAVDVVELEETAYRFSERVAALSADVSLHEAASLPEELYEDIGELPLRVLRQSRISETTVVAAVSASPAQVVIVDHIQQIPTPGSMARTYGLEALLSRLAHVATRQQKALLVAAQLNRGLEARRDEPTLADLRDSGALEQIARQVWLLYWPNKHDPSRDPRDYLIHVAKHSEGPTGKVPLRWDARSGQFWEAP